MKAQSSRQWENALSRQIAAVRKQIDELFDKLAWEAAAIAETAPYDGEKPFSFDDYPITRQRVNKLLDKMRSGVRMYVSDGIDNGWLLANNKNDAIVDEVLQGVSIAAYYDHHETARAAFKARTDRGMNLSDRVWKYSDQFKSEVEMSIDVALKDGMSATDLSREVRKYLKDTDRLFRRVKDEHGMLHLSKRAAAYHPGRGVYRSSYKNALRMAATEINMAYRTADYERYQDLDFVVGIRIELSNNHTLNGVKFTDVCDELSAPRGSNATSGRGCYPKDFKFTGWHPLCRCTTFSILKTDEETDADVKKLLRGEKPDNRSVNRVTDVPKEFKQWITDNAERIDKAKSMPYFITDNEDEVNALMWLSAERYKEFRRLKSGSNYYDVKCNALGGIKATHKGHNFDKNKGWYETTVQDVGFMSGHIVVLEKEDHSVLNKRNTEGFWDKKRFEIAAAESGTTNNIRNALKHCASKPDCDVAVVFFPNEIDEKAIHNGYSKYCGLKGTTQFKDFKEVIFVGKSGIIAVL